MSYAPSPLSRAAPPTRAAAPRRRAPSRPRRCARLRRAGEPLTERVLHFGRGRDARKGGQPRLVRSADDADVEPGADGERGTCVFRQAYVLKGHDGSRPDDQQWQGCARLPCRAGSPSVERRRRSRRIRSCRSRTQPALRMRGLRSAQGMRFRRCRRRSRSSTAARGARADGRPAGGSWRLPPGGGRRGSLPRTRPRRRRPRPRRGNGRHECAVVGACHPAELGRADVAVLHNQCRRLGQQRAQVVGGRGALQAFGLVPADEHQVGAAGQGQQRGCGGAGRPQRRAVVDIEGQDAASRGHAVDHRVDQRGARGSSRRW